MVGGLALQQEGLEALQKGLYNSDKGGHKDMVSYSDLFLILTFIVALVSLILQICKKK